MWPGAHAAVLQLVGEPTHRMGSFSLPASTASHKDRDSRCKMAETLSIPAEEVSVLYELALALPKQTGFSH